MKYCVSFFMNFLSEWANKAMHENLRLTFGDADYYRWSYMPTGQDEKSKNRDADFHRWSYMPMGQNEKSKNRDADFHC